MFNALNYPNLVNIFGRLLPDDLAWIQQQMMSDPELLQMANRGLQNLRPEYIKLFALAEQLKNVWPDQMAEIGEKILEKATSMSAMFGSRVSYDINAAAEMLKKQGNELHGQGKYSSALEKYILAKHNLKYSSSSGRDLLSACSLNMMSCYLKTRQFEECISEGREVLAYDASNLKALYRRGQAYKELGKLKDAVSDLTKALEVCPADDTIAEALRDAEERLMRERGAGQSKGLIIEEIVDEATALSENNSIVSESELTSQENSNETVNLIDREEEFTRILEDIKSRSDPETWSALVEALDNDCSDVEANFNLIGMMSHEELRRICVLCGVEDEGSDLAVLKSLDALFGQMSDEDLKRVDVTWDVEGEGLIRITSREELRRIYGLCCLEDEASDVAVAKCLDAFFGLVSDEDNKKLDAIWDVEGEGLNRITIHEEIRRMRGLYGVKDEASDVAVLKSLDAFFGRFSDEDQKKLGAILAVDVEGLSLTQLSGFNMKHYPEEYWALYEGYKDDLNAVKCDMYTWMATRAKEIFEVWFEMRTKMTVEEGKELLKPHDLFTDLKLTSRLSSTESRQLLHNLREQFVADFTAAGAESDGCDVGAASLRKNVAKLMRNPAFQQKALLDAKTNGEMIFKKMAELYGYHMSPEELDWLKQSISCLSPDDFVDPVNAVRTIK